MSDSNTDSPEESSGLLRRRFVQAASASGVSAGTVGLAGCLGDDDGDSALILSSSATMTEAEEPITDALYEAGLDEEIEVDIRAEDFETGNPQSEYNSALEAGRSEPDIFMMDSGWTILFIVRDYLLNISDNLSDDVVEHVENEYLEAAVETAKDPESGGLYGVPLYLDVPTMQYRKDLVEEAGYDPEGENWTTEPLSWQEFSQIAADVRDQTGTEHGFTTQAATYEGLSCCTFNETMSSFGGAYFGDHDNLFGPVGERAITINEQPVPEAIRMMQTFIAGDDADNPLEGYEQICPSAVVQWTEKESLGMFTNGNSVFHRNWPYSIVINGAEEAFGEDLGVMPIPYGVEEDEAEYEGTGGSRAALGGWHLTVNPNSQRIEETIQVLETFTQENIMLTVFEETEWIPPIPRLIESDEAENVEILDRYIETLRFASETTVPRPVPGIWSQQSQLIYQEVHDAYTLEKTAEEAMDDLEDKLEQSEQE